MNNVPWLRSGTGATPSDGGCIMQVVDWIHRNEWSDTPPCVHPAIRRVAISLNDRLDDEGRQQLLDLAPRMMNTNSDDKMLSVRLALWAAESVLDIWTDSYPEDDRPLETIKATQEYIDNPNSQPAANAADAAARAAYAAADAAAYAAASAAARAAAYAAASAAARAANAAAYAAASAAARAAHAASYAAAAYAYAADEEAEIDFLVALLDEYDRITGRDSVESLDYTEVCKVMA